MGGQSCSDSVATWAGTTVLAFGIQGFPLIYSVSLIFIVTCYDTSGYLPTSSLSSFCPRTSFHDILHARIAIIQDSDASDQQSSFSSLGSSCSWWYALSTWVRARYPFVPGGQLQLQHAFVFLSSDSFR